jgi:AraC-like DNA-binding protein
MDYLEFDPPQSLRRHVQCVWRLRDPAPSRQPQTIYPDGRCELIAHLGEPMRVLASSSGWQQQAHCIFAGQHQAAIRLAAVAQVDCVGVRLRPAASAAVAGARLVEYTERTVDLAQIDVRFAAGFSVACREFSRDPQTRSLWQCLEARLLPHAIDERVEAAVAHLESQHGRSRIDATAAAAAMSLRSFQIRFLACVGLSAKAFARVLRLQATIRAIDRGVESLAQLACDTGFSDQAHATREVQQLTGLTPARLRAALRTARDEDRTVQLAAVFVRGTANNTTMKSR